MNFKREVKSHKVRLQAYCNKPLLKRSYLYFSVTCLHGYDVTSTRREVATRLLSKRCTCSRHLVTVAPPKKNIWVFVKIRALRANDVTTTLGGGTPNILSKRCICCPRLVIIIPLEVNYLNERRFEILRTIFVSCFCAFYVIKFESKQFCEIFVVNSLNYCFFKRFLLINLNKVVFWRTQIDTPIRYPIWVISVFNWLGFYMSKYFILRIKKIHSI